MFATFWYKTVDANPEWFIFDYITAILKPKMDLYVGIAVRTGMGFSFNLHLFSSLTPVHYAVLLLPPTFKRGRKKEKGKVNGQVESLFSYPISL